MSRLRKKDALEALPDDNSPPAIKHTTEGSSMFAYVGNLIKKPVLFLGGLYCSMLFLVWISSTLRRQLVFVNYLYNPFANYADTASYKLTSTTNFYIQGKAGKLGVWHIPAKDSTSIDDGKPVIFYMHGNAYSRVGKHRVALYKVLSALGCHVVAHDYRGFGDSDGSPTEEGLIDDSLVTFQWILANTNRSPVFLWGHSLGSAVAVALSKILTETDISVKGVILEAPFNNMKDAAFNHPLSIPYRFLPFFQDTLQEINGMFRSDEVISSVKYDMLILHDHGDGIVEFKLGMKLYEAAMKHKKENQLIHFKEFRGFSHTTLYTSQEFPETIRNFMKLDARTEEL